MNTLLRILTFSIALLAPQWAAADGLQDNLPAEVRRVPRMGIELTADQRRQVEAGLEELGEQMKKLEAHSHPVFADRLPDIQILHRAVSDALRYQEFFKESEIDDALRLLQLGNKRAASLLLQLKPQVDGERVAPRPASSSFPAWLQHSPNNLVVRGYRSKIDHTVQPYGLVLPEGYAYESGRKYRLDVWFHGRGETMSENVFLSQRLRNKGVFAPADTIVLHPYGRYSNAFKFAGEVDVLEAIEHVRKHYNIDEDRISVRGFSMGGAACWQFAVHYADRWFAANPGAGFSETPEFLKSFQKEQLSPTWFEEKLWRLYDCNRWAGNLLHCPTVAYSGEADIQKQAADIMEASLIPLGIKLVHLIGPKTGHKYHPEAAKEVGRRLDSLALKGRNNFPHYIDFTTFTLKYNRMHWITIDALAQHWEQATVKAQIAETPQINLIVRNVRQLTIDVPPGNWPHRIDKKVKVFVNGKGGDVVRPMSDGSLKLTLRNKGEDWLPVTDEPHDETVLRKRHNLQGPIDDALMDSFIFVRPTGQSKNKRVDAWAATELERAIEHWRRHFRGYARVKNDTAITEDDIRTANLILWGTPDSNKLMNQIASQLPIRWSTEEIEVGEQRYPSSEHALIAIYPNPLHPARYVVFNSSFTFREYAYLNNARQVPKLPDWAIVDTRKAPDSLWPGKIVAANFFDETWQLRKE